MANLPSVEIIDNMIKFHSIDTDQYILKANLGHLEFANVTNSRMEAFFSERYKPIVLECNWLGYNQRTQCQENFKKITKFCMKHFRDPPSNSNI